MRSLLFLVLLLAPAPVSAAAVTLSPVLSTEVAALLQRPPGSLRLGLLVRDLSSGQILEASRADELFVPASTMKLVSMAARLTQGSPDETYRVDATAPAQELSAKATRLSRLTLRGGGDPSFSVSGAYSLSALAQQLAARGIKEVGELSLGAQLGSRTWPALPLGTPVVALRLSDEPGWNDTPEQYAGRVIRAFTNQLQAAGIRVGLGGELGRRVGESAAPQFAKVLEGAGTPTDAAPLPDAVAATVRGQPLITLLRRTLKPSDNVWAEQLAANLGAGNGVQAATHAGMLAELRRFLTQAGVEAAPLKLNDASGLSSADRLTPRALVTVLQRMYDLPFTKLKTPLTPEQAFAQRQNLFIEALPRGGTGEASAQARETGGTLAGRFVGSGLDVRAKTGTLPGVSSLAGYVRSKSGHVLAFAIMVDQAKGNTLDVRAYQDKLLAVIARRH